jgi:methionyl-tRNA formyltransferase
MRLILMGTGPFAVPSFQALVEKGYDIASVVTRPTAVATGKKELSPSPVRQFAIDRQLPLSDPQSINEPTAIEWLIAQQADLMVVCDYGQILSRNALSAAKLGGINLHGSLLPRHRGAAPVQWSILSGDSTAGVSVIHMTPALDGGPVLNQNSIAIAPADTATSLETKLSLIGVPSTLDAVELLATKSSLDECADLGVPQDKSLATKAPRLAKEDGELNLHYPVLWIDRLVRGLQPWPGSFAHLIFPDGKSLRIIIPEVSPLAMDMAAIPFVPGDLLYGAQLRPLAATHPVLTAKLYAVAIDGLIAISNLQPAGKKLMTAEEFLRGYSRYPSMKIQCAPGSHRLLNTISCS